MRITLRQLGAGAAFLLILVSMLLGLSYLLVPRSSSMQNPLRQCSAGDILYEKENSVDVIFIGDSEAYSSVSPMQIWHEQGFTSYVCAAPAQYITRSKDMLETALRRQTPRAVIIEANMVFREIKGEGKLLEDVKRLFAVFKFHKRWKNMSASGFFSNDSWQSTFKGYCYNSTSVPADSGDYMRKTDARAPIADDNFKCLSQMVSMCAEKGVRVIIYSAPNKKSWSFEKHNAISDAAARLGCEFIDLNVLGEVGIDWQTDTKDGGDHVNHSGAKKVSAYLGKYLKNELSLPDRRGDESLAEWDKAYKDYEYQTA